MNRASPVLRSIQIALDAIAAEIASDGVGSGKAVESVEQLGAMQAQLKSWRDELLSDSIMPRNQRRGGMGRVICDSWPLDSRLGSLIIEAEKSYLGF